MKSFFLKIVSPWRGQQAFFLLELILALLLFSVMLGTVLAFREHILDKRIAKQIENDSQQIADAIAAYRLDLKDGWQSYQPTIESLIAKRYLKGDSATSKEFHNPFGNLYSISSLTSKYVNTKQQIFNVNILIPETYRNVLSILEESLPLRIMEDCKQQCPAGSGLCCRIDLPVLEPFLKPPQFNYVDEVSLKFPSDTLYPSVAPRILSGKQPAFATVPEPKCPRWYKPTINYAITAFTGWMHVRSYRAKHYSSKYPEPYIRGRYGAYITTSTQNNEYYLRLETIDSIYDNLAPVIINWLISGGDKGTFKANWIDNDQWSTYGDWTMVMPSEEVLLEKIYRSKALVITSCTPS